MSNRFLSLAAATALTAALASPAAADDRNAQGRSEADKMVCKRELATGSLVRANKQCRTALEWARIAESQRTGATKMVDELMTKTGGNN